MFLLEGHPEERTSASTQPEVRREINDGGNRRSEWGGAGWGGGGWYREQAVYDFEGKLHGNHPAVHNTFDIYMTKPAVNVVVASGVAGKGQSREGGAAHGTRHTAPRRGSIIPSPVPGVMCYSWVPGKTHRLKAL